MSGPTISVDILSSPRPGGPLRWSRDLARWVGRQPGFRSRVVTDIPHLLLAHLYTSADIIHASIPLTLHPKKSKYILTVKGDYTIERNFWRGLYPRAIRTADIVTVPSHYLKDRIPDLANAVVIPNAVNLEEFESVQLIDRSELQLTIVSNFWFPEKIRGIVHLLELLTKVRTDSTLPKFSLQIVGDGEYLTTVKQRASQAPFKVVFHGWTDPRKVFSNTDIFLYYSYHDNMPNAVLEAMAVGLPVVTNLVGAIHEMIANGQSGIIAQSDEAYLAALNETLKSFARRQELGQAARQRIANNFSWEKIVWRFIEMYRK